jgi:ribose-phosphate pyrophosphokinase
MKYLNLSPGFNPYGAHKEDIIKFDAFTFNGGEPHIKLNALFNTEKEERHFVQAKYTTASVPVPPLHNNVTVTTRIRSFGDMGMLLVAIEALRGLRYNHINLFLPYFPGARQDRRMVPGEPFTVKIYADLINRLGLDKVTIFDPHSDVTPALLNNCEVIDNYRLAEHAIKENINCPFNLVSIDAGAAKKIGKLGKYLFERKIEAFDIIQCNKKRNTRTGDIEAFEVFSDDLGGKPTFIVDDIADGGASFIHAAEELKNKNAGALYLIVSHGIFSKGFKELRKHYKAIYTTDSWVNDYPMDIPQIEKGSEIVNMIKLGELI